MSDRKPHEKAENFIGWKSEDGKLEVIGIHGKQGNASIFKVTCTECCKDKELFPDGYFVSLKCHLVNNRKPCGCAKTPRWTKEQFLILARRAAKDRFLVHGFAEEFYGQKTKLELECLVDGHKWTASSHHIINRGHGCPKCKGINLAEQKKIPEPIALRKCTDICEEMNYDVVGFPDGYKNAYSHFEYVCKIHGKQNTRYSHFIHSGVRCVGCAKDRQREIGNGNGYFPERKDEKDFLYILNFNSKFIKVGRSFDIDQRIKSLRTESKIKKIHKLRIFTATHQEIYGLEQEIHSELRERNFQHYVDWSTECFENECLFTLNKLLDICGLTEIS